MTGRASARLGAVRGLAGEFVRFMGGKAWLAGALMILGAALESASLALIVPMTSILTQPGGGGAVRQMLRPLGLATGAAPLGQLAVVLAMFVALMAMRAVILGSRDQMLTGLQLDFADRQRFVILHLLASSRWQDIAGLRHARVANAMASDIPRMASAIQFLLAVVTAAVMLAAQWALVLFLAPGMALLALLLLAVAGLAARPMFRRAVVLGEDVQRGNLSILDRVGQWMGGLKLALAQNMQAAFVEEMGATLTLLNRRQRHFGQRQSRIRTLSTTGTALALAIAVLAGAALKVTPPVLIASLAILTRMAAPATLILRCVQQLAMLLPSYGELARLRRDMEASPRPHPAAVASDLPQGGRIRFDRVSYRYAQANGEAGGGLHDLSLTIEPGEIIGITGPSGAGKTSFVDLLSGLLVPDRGSIEVAGIPLDPSRLESWRGRIAYVTQDSYLFHDSIRRNLSWGLEGMDDDALWAVLDQVGAADIVRGLDGGLDALAGERGGRLSGGERQRIGLARALLRRSELLILDEATSAIDIAAEQRLLERIAALSPRPTIILVAHRRETLHACDRVLTFDHGRLSEDRDLALRPASGG